MAKLELVIRCLPRCSLRSAFVAAGAGRSRHRSDDEPGQDRQAVARRPTRSSIGNPAIADASVQDASTIVLTGKGFGVTNLVVLDADGQPDRRRAGHGRRAHDASSVRIYRRAAVQTLSCTPYCESSYKSDAERTSEAEMSAGQ